MTDRYENIRKALAMGPTPGTRRVIDGDSHPYVTVALPENEGCRWNDPIVCALYEDVTPDDYIGFGALLQALPNARANAAYIAACDPDTIRELLEERDALSAKVESLRTDAERYRWLRKGESDDVAVVRGLGAMDYGMSTVVSTYFEPFRLVVEVYAGWGRAAPIWASLQITPDFLHGIADKASFCKEHDVYSVTAPMPLNVEWESGNDLRIQGEILVVHDAGFQIEAYPARAGYPVYTREVTLTVLESIAKGEIPKAGFYGDARKLSDRVFCIASDRWILDDIVEDYLSFQEDQAVA